MAIIQLSCKTNGSATATIFLRQLVKYHCPTGAAVSALMSTPGVTSTSLLTSEFTLVGNRQ